MKSSYFLATCILLSVANLSLSMWRKNIPSFNVMLFSNFRMTWFSTLYSTYYYPDSSMPLTASCWHSVIIANKPIDIEKFKRDIPSLPQHHIDLLFCAGIAFHNEIVKSLLAPWVNWSSQNIKAVARASNDNDILKRFNSG